MMKCPIRARQLVLFLLLLFLTAFVFSGCSVPRVSRQWTQIPYEEVVRITTEPANCRIYFQDEYIGISPTTIHLDGGKGTVIQTGTRGTLKDTSQTLWEGFHFQGYGPKYWTVKAVKEGYEPAVAEIGLTEDSPSFLQAAESLKVVSGHRLSHAGFIGSRSLLLILNPKAAE
jgi:hypothetical protein